MSQSESAAWAPTLSPHAPAGVRMEVNEMDEQQHRCTAETYGLRCDLPVGHEGDHEGRGLWVDGSSSRYVWTNDARELERRLEDANA